MISSQKKIPYLERLEVQVKDLNVLPIIRSSVYRLDVLFVASRYSHTHMHMLSTAPRCRNRRLLD